MTQALFQPVYEGGGPTIAPRDVVNKALGLCSDYLNWNTQPEIERRLRAVLCEIYGHQPYAGPPMTWKPKGECYWCHVQCVL